MEVQKVTDNILYLVMLGSLGGLALASSVIVLYVRYQRRFIKQQAERMVVEQQYQQALVASIIKSQEEERLRISKDLHDQVGAALSGLRMQVAQLQVAAADSATVSRIATDTKAGLDVVLQDVRNLSHMLSPAGLELWGLHEALEGYCEQVARTAKLEISIDDRTNGILTDLPFDIALSVFRIIQELITNTLKHAQASCINLVIEKSDALRITYTDNGKGMDAAAKPAGIGMYNINCRLKTINAHYHVRTAPQQGYIFEMTLPTTLLQQHG